MIRKSKSNSDDPEGGVSHYIVEGCRGLLGLDQQSQRFPVRIDLADHYEGGQDPGKESEERVERVARDCQRDPGQPGAQNRKPGKDELPDVDRGALRPRCAQSTATGPQARSTGSLPPSRRPGRCRSRHKPQSRSGTQKRCLPGNKRLFR